MPLGLYSIGVEMFESIAFDERYPPPNIDHRTNEFELETFKNICSGVWDDWHGCA